jgi:hypothetical protein
MTSGGAWVPHTTWLESVLPISCRKGAFGVSRKSALPQVAGYIRHEPGVEKKMSYGFFLAFFGRGPDVAESRYKPTAPESSASRGAAKKKK